MRIKLAGSAVALLASLVAGAVLLVVLVVMGGRYLIMGGGEEQTHRNRLAAEKSPYLLQHADNPVDWYPWGEEAFDKAREEDKPIFLSIGYSTCHWCHVMEQESFEDPDVAELMNDTFVSIKVDREERPDIDNVYMTVTQMMTGSGGWPLTIIMTPEREPFFAATYIPKETKRGGPSMLKLIPEVARTWKEKRKEVMDSAHESVAVLNRAADIEAGGDVDSSVIDAAYKSLSSNFDEAYGGFGKAPKFPTPHQQVFLIRYGMKAGEERALAMAEKTLDAMRRGGIYDHLGFGFHRYSTDAQWLVPHFEKMLYDQALIAMAYIEAYRATGKAVYRDTAEEIFTYVLRDMTSPGGAFYSAEDADSEGEEGMFYTWTAGEVEKVLGEKDAEVAFGAWGFEEGGNFDGRNIIHLPKGLDDDVKDALEVFRKKLFKARGKRARPYRDDKVLASWNGLMIAALAGAAVAFDEPSYAEAAGRAADFVLDEMRAKDVRLLRRYRDGEAAIPGMANDYAFFIWGLIELYEATFDVRYLEVAIDLNEQFIARFWDEKDGGFFVTPDDGEKLISRLKESSDGALPSANSVGMMNLLRLARIAERPEWEEMADSIARAFSRAIAKTPAAHAQLLQALDFAEGPSFEVVVVGTEGSPDTEEMLGALRAHYAPDNVVLFRPAGEDDPAISKIAAFTKSQHMVDGKATAYVCENYTCKRPTNDVEEMLKLLRGADDEET